VLTKVLGREQGFLKKYEEALKCYDKALEITPGYSMALAGKKLAFENLQVAKQSASNTVYKFCPTCGNKFGSNMKFCGKCGFKL